MSSISQTNPHSHGWGFLLTNNYRIMSDLEKILNDDLLKCKIVESVENPVRRVDLIKWTHDNTYSIAEVRKDTGKLEVTDLKLPVVLTHTSISTEIMATLPYVAKTPHDNVGNHYEPLNR